jgi:hypothetical protein
MVREKTALWRKTIILERARTLWESGRTQLRDIQLEEAGTEDCRTGPRTEAGRTRVSEV